MVEESIRAAIYRELSSSESLLSIATGIYDHVPQSDDPGAGVEFPYIVVGDTTIVPWDSDTEVGAEITATIHTWSRYKGRKEAATIHDIIYSILHRSNFDVDGASVVGCDFEHSEIFVDSDGETRHGVQRYRILIDSIF